MNKLTKIATIATIALIGATTSACTAGPAIQAPAAPLTPTTDLASHMPTTDPLPAATRDFTNAGRSAATVVPRTRTLNEPVGCARCN